MDKYNYKERAKKIRLRVLDLIFKAQSSHIGSCFSLVDILTVLYDKVDWDKDEIIISKGWAAAGVYATMEHYGMIDPKELDTYCQEGSKYIGLLEPGVHPKIKVAGGSMQFGMPFAVGFALSKKMKGEEGMVYCIMSDGELAGGMVWESLLIACHHKLNNLSIIVDNNGFQAMGKIENILYVEVLNLGYEVDGHDYERISHAISHFNENTATAHVFKTVKGKGVSFMENNNLYHYKNLSEDEYLKAKAELNG